MSTGVTELGTKEVGEVHQNVKYSSFSSYMLKTPSLLTQEFKENNKEQEKLLKHICNFGALAVWINGRRAASYYIGVDTRKYQHHLINPTTLDCITS